MTEDLNPLCVSASLREASVISHKSSVISLLLSFIPLLSLQAEWRGGVARQDITPDYPVMLSGYGSRKEPAQQAKVSLWAKALALSWDGEAPSLILCVDNCAVPASLRAEVVAALAAEGVEESRLNLCSTHTHCAPALTTSLVNLFGHEPDEAQRASIQRYTADLRRHLISVSKKALKKMQPVKLEHGEAKASFAKNRRLKTPAGFTNSINPDGPVDHTVPLLKMSSLSGEVLGVFASYACHCTTLNWNYFHPDWAGLAALHVEMAFPQAVCLMALGCGADQNPHPRGKEDDARIHGFEMGKSIRHGCVSKMRLIRGPITPGQRSLQLAFAPLPEAAQLETLTQPGKSLQTQRHARHFLERQRRAQPLTPLPYTVQTLQFGKDLAMVFLNGEVVVDYSLRLKRELDAKRLWVNAYSNDVQAYIPSERVLQEGGYEGGGAMIYYFLPGPFAPGLEDQIIRTVKELLPEFVDL